MVRIPARRAVDTIQIPDDVAGSPAAPAHRWPFDVRTLALVLSLLLAFTAGVAVGAGGAGTSPQSSVRPTLAPPQATCTAVLRAWDAQLQDPARYQPIGELYADQCWRILNGWPATIPLPSPCATISNDVSEYCSSHP